MTRRCITIQLAPQCEIPAARTFIRPDLVAEVRRERGQYISAAMTIVRAWIVAGRPKADLQCDGGLRRLVRPLSAAFALVGFADPTASVFEAIAEDPDRETLGRLLTGWRSAFGKTAAMVRDAVKQVSMHHDMYTELNEVMRDIADERGEINRRKLGWWIKRHAGQIVDGCVWSAPVATARPKNAGGGCGIGFAGFASFQCAKREKCQYA